MAARVHDPARAVLALSKRRHELTLLTESATDHRPILADYTPYLLDQMISVVTASTLIAYTFYTISPETTAKFGTDLLSLTIPFPLYGISATCTSSTAARTAEARPNWWSTIVHCWSAWHSGRLR